MSAGMHKLKVIDRELLDRVSTDARSNPRLRKNFNLHPTDDFPCHRLLNAVEPGTYIRPHRHLDPAKDESMVMVRGRMGIVIFEEDGTVAETVMVGAGSQVVAVDIPHFVYHTLVSLETGSIFFEAKSGPFVPLTEDEKASWSPAEDSPDVLDYLATLRRLF